MLLFRFFGHLKQIPAMDRYVTPGTLQRWPSKRKQKAEVVGRPPTLTLKEQKKNKQEAIETIGPWKVLLDASFFPPHMAKRFVSIQLRWSSPQRDDVLCLQPAEE